YYSVEQVPWLVDEWLPEATIGFVVAPPGSYKTWLAFDMVVAIASGKPFLGKYPVNRTGPVLIIQQEDYHGDIANRLGAIIAARFELGAKADEERFEIVTPPDLPIYIHPDRSLRFDDSGAMAMLEERIAELRPVLVIRSEERRVGKECRCQRPPAQENKQNDNRAAPPDASDRHVRAGS